MQKEALREAVFVAHRMGHVLIATADRDGLPHVAVADRMSLLETGRVTVTAWFCPDTLENLRVNSALAVVIWDPVPDSGFQLLGASEGVEDIAFLDGSPFAHEAGHPVPQVESKVTMRVDRILEFTRQPHSDREK